MQLTEDEKKKLQEKIDQQPAARKERIEKTIGISIGIISGLLLPPIGIIIGTYWFLHEKKTRGIYAIMAIAWVMCVVWCISMLLRLIR